ncbi:MAG TPA: hypothetical protein VLZ82_08090 [Microbacterium sp.]|nr:hypothetical protein [Microbacterium sp.]
MSATVRPPRHLDAPPTKRHSAPVAAAPSEPAFELVDIDRYVVLHDGPVGYVEVVPPLFICYAGHPYPRAVEVAQVFDFEQAVSCVLERAAPPAQGRSAA